MMTSLCPVTCGTKHGDNEQRGRSIGAKERSRRFVVLSIEKKHHNKQKFRYWRWQKQEEFVPDEGSEGCGAQTHVALDPEEANEQSCDSLHQPQVVELFGVFGVDLLQTQRGQGGFIRAPLLYLCLQGNLLPVFKPGSLRLGSLITENNRLLNILQHRISLTVFNLLALLTDHLTCAAGDLMSTKVPTFTAFCAVQHKG